MGAEMSIQEEMTVINKAINGTKEGVPINIESINATASILLTKMTSKPEEAGELFNKYLAKRVL